ncbi:Lysozyme 3,Lysozyme 2,Lysozyme 1,Invertebrate-type lysozyme,Lysozyme [Mytilus coruscus]|uniref:lysozyme n=1 Tax=Mytilus coruscus TaxID=42192 RepID=A0A6J8C3V5_MYTCO|nr:Lysozyme 3,Lysozyme 2,Lysozyme 1,Invertebrate-type lysozyme,Lysozyme [Mytilus coruscus]
MFGYFLIFSVIVAIARASISGHIATGTCVCVTGSTVNARHTASIHGHIIGQVHSGECFKFNGGIHTADGYTWYQLQHVHGQLESGCRPLDCKWDVNSNSCGYLQIKQVYWEDCGKPGGSLEACSKDKHCASQCVQHYMSRYINHYGCAHNCESYARMHNGGPAGCKHTNTLGYWNNIQSRGCRANS